MTDLDPPADTSPTIPPPPSSDAKTLEVRGASVPDAATVSPASGSDAATLSLASDLLGGLPAAGSMFGRYRLLGELGHGAMGVVWKAHDTRLDRDVALKQIRAGALADASQVERFEREARLSARLVHPGIVAVHDVGVEGGTHYFTSDYVPSRSLEEVLRGPVTLDQAISWTKALAEALHHAHQQGVVHRDVKPANVLIDDARRPHLTDFGLAKEVSLAAESTLTAVGTLLGSPAYMSPEQATTRTQDVGPASDQFSLGVVLYEMICLARPFRGDSLRDLLDAIAEREPARPTTINRRIPADLETICLRCLEKDPEARYASMSDLAEDLGRCLAGEPVRARPIGSVVRVLRRARKRPGVLALAVLALAAGTYALVSHRLHEKETEENARRSAAAEQAALLKGERVAEVLLRWAELRPAFDEMERVRTDVTLRQAERVEALARLRGPIDAFARAAPADATSQSAMKALVAWADHLCGRPSDAEAGLRDAAALDPDLPYAPLIQAMRRTVPYLASQPIPSLLVGPEVLDIAEPEAETPERRALRLDAQAWLAKAGAARVWGKGLAEDFRKAIDAMSMACDGRYEESERRLSEVLDRARMPAFEVELRYARARVRFLLRRPVEALQDMDAVCAARPRSEEPLSFRAWIGMGAAERKTARGEDARAEFDSAISSSGEGIALLRKARDPATLAMALGHRASIRFMRAQSVPGAESDEDLRLCDQDLREARTLAAPDVERWVIQATVAMKLGERASLRGEDPREWYRASLDACDRALGLSPENPSARIMRAIVRRDRGAWRAEHGEDPREDLGVALRELDAIVAKAPGGTDALFQRARLRSIQGERASLTGVDAAQAFELGIADLDLALAGGERADFRLERATLLAQRGQAEKAAGGDPRAWYVRAAADADAAVDRAPSENAFFRRGLMRAILGGWLANQGFDPRADLRAAQADFGEASRRDARDPIPWNNLAIVLRDLGEFDQEARALERALALPGADKANLEARLGTARRDARTIGETGLPAWAYKVGYALQAIAKKDYATARDYLMKARAWMKPEDEGMIVNEYRHADMLFDLACLSGMESEGKLEGKPVDARRAAWLLEAGFANLHAALECGYSNAEKVRTDPDLSALRADPRWREIERRLPK